MICRPGCAQRRNATRALAFRRNFRTPSQLTIDKIVFIFQRINLKSALYGHAAGRTENLDDDMIKGSNCTMNVACEFYKADTLSVIIDKFAKFQAIFAY